MTQKSNPLAPTGSVGSQTLDYKGYSGDFMMPKRKSVLNKKKLFESLREIAYTYSTKRRSTGYRQKDSIS